MSLISEAKREHKKLAHEILQRQRRLHMLETVMGEYNIRLYPSTQTLYALIVECLKENMGHASFDAIIDNLTHRGIEMPRQRISLALTKHPGIHYNKHSGEWEIKEPKTSAQSRKEASG